MMSAWTVEMAGQAVTSLSTRVVLIASKNRCVELPLFYTTSGPFCFLSIDGTFII